MASKPVQFLGECPADSRHSPAFSLAIDLSQGSPRRDFAITLLDTLRLPKQTIVTCISGSLWPGYKPRSPTIQISSACTTTIYIMCSWRGAKPRTPGKAKLVNWVLFHFVLDFGFLVCLLGHPDFDFDLYIVLPTGVALMVLLLLQPYLIFFCSPWITTVMRPVRASCG